MTLIAPTHPLLNYSHEFRELCEPLKSFGIHHVTYQKKFLDGTRVSLSNEPEWIADYYNLGLYESSLFEERPENYIAEYQIFTGEYCDLQVHKHGREKFNSTSTITITQPQKDGCEFYFFGASPDNKTAIHYLSNHMEILHHFILYVKDRGVTLLKKAMNHKITLPELAEAYLREKAASKAAEKKFYASLQSAREKFFQTTHVYQYVFEAGENMGTKLSNREIDCIYFLLHNKTAKETAREMNISHRTVEFYLEGIRIKLNCESKSDLILKLASHPILKAIR